MAATPLQSAQSLLARAVELDTAQRYSEALICYEEAIQMLIKCIPELKTEAAMKEMRGNIEEYLGRAEKIKGFVKEERDGALDRVHYVEIKEGSTGHSYHSLLKDFLDGNVTEVAVLDPYIRAKHQIHNFVRFCELLVKSCPKLKGVTLTTGEGDENQKSALQCLQDSLQKHNTQLTVTYSATLHDREIRLSNGWIIKIGRGLDYFQRPEGPFTIGFSDYDLRPCLETTVEIFHRLNASRKRQSPSSSALKEGTGQTSSAKR